MTDDRLNLVFATLDAEAAPAPAFAAALFESLASDLGFRGRALAPHRRWRLAPPALPFAPAVARAAYAVAVVGLVAVLGLAVVAVGDRLRDERVTPPSASPVAPSSSPTISPSPLPSATPIASPFAELRPLTPGVERIVVGLMGTGSYVSQALLLGVDGSGPDWLVRGVTAGNACQSADGRAFGIWLTDPSGREAIYLVPEGAAPVLVSTDATSFLCGFPSDAMLLTYGAEGDQRLVRHDLATGAETPLGEHLSALAVSPDGQAVAAVCDCDSGPTLVVLDVETRAINGRGGDSGLPLRSATWSPDGRWIAIVVGPIGASDASGAGEYRVRVVDAGRQMNGPRFLVATTGRPPIVAWSADATRISVFTPTHESMEVETAGGLQVVDVADGTARAFAKDDVIFAGWSPIDAERFAYATTTSLYTVRGSGEPQLLAERPTLTCDACPSGSVVRWPAGDWLGWSPDGRWIGLGTFTGAVRLLSAETGVLTTLLRETDAWMLVGQAWWP